MNTPRFTLTSRNPETLSSSSAAGLGFRLILFVMTIAIHLVGAPKQQADAQTWKLATDDTEVVISVRGGWPVLEVLRPTAVRHNWLKSPLKEPLMPTVEVAGVRKDLDWIFEHAEINPDGRQLTLHYRNALPKLSLDSVWRAREGYGPVVHFLTLVNESGKSITVLRPESLTLTGLAIPSTELVQAWWIKRGGGNASTEGGTFHAEVNASFEQVLTSDPTDGSSPVPWMA